MRQHDGYLDLAARAQHLERDVDDERAEDDTTDGARAAVDPQVDKSVNMS